VKRSTFTQMIVSLTDDVLIRATFDRFHTAATYLRRQGVAKTWIAQWGSAFGRKAVAAYRKVYGTEPRSTWEDGRRVAVYGDTTALDAAMTHYVQHAVAGPQLAAGYDRKRAAKRQLRDVRGRFTRAYVVTWVGRAGANARGHLTIERAARLAQRLMADHRMVAVAVRDAHGHRVDVALCA